MICPDQLIGLERFDAEGILRSQSIPYRTVFCAGPRPLEEADSVRVVRVRDDTDGITELLTCEFKTQLSQG